MNGEHKRLLSKKSYGPKCGVLCVGGTLTYIAPGSAPVQSYVVHQAASVVGSGYQRQAFHHALLDPATKTKRSYRHLDTVT